MRRQRNGFLTAALALATLLVVSAPPAAAQTTGSENFRGVLVVDGSSGSRVVLASVIVMRGVFNGVGRIVEVDNLPTDPDTVSRDDLVFADGVIHIVNTTLDVSSTLNPRSCIGTAKLTQVTTIAGGTGRFANATGTTTGNVTGIGIARRNPDGSCDPQVLLHELDLVAGSGTLSF
jgi:hypothetical protein